MSDLFPPELVDAISQGTVTDQEMEHLVSILLDADIIEDSRNQDASETIDEEGTVQILADGTASFTPFADVSAQSTIVTVTKQIFKQRVSVDTRVRWRGIRSRIERRNVYKTVTLAASVPTDDAEKWRALFVCIAGSSALTLALASALVTGGITAPLVVAAVLASAVSCFGMISPETFQQEARIRIGTARGSWG